MVSRRTMIPEGPRRIAGSVSDDSDALQNNAASSSNFICGVVEGFYGRPWTSDQRKKLFKRMNKMGMNTYIYAPKDDSKHRMYWRELYTVEEADMLTILIEAAEENGVTFVYALSPGLDMSYSSAKEVSCLKRKLSQVASFGCKAFALLFDDIEADMCEADKGFFQSFAFAQVSVTNEVYQYLHEPRNFYFCPTEYCASRAVPSVPQSEYLQTVGSKLLKGIDVMWTGPKVISKRISIKSIEEVAAVLGRPPLIWDNIHANDYDQKRIFLGPYDGRSPELIPYLRGVLTNPNCEFESNFIALHTLAQWSRSNADGVKRDCILSASPMNSADIKLETDGEYTVDEDSPAAHTSPHAYIAKQALQIAIMDWHSEFFEKCSAARRLNPTHSVYPAYSFPTLLPPAPIMDSKSTSCPPSTELAMPVTTLKTALDPMAVLEMTDTYAKPPSAVVPHNGLINHDHSSNASSSSHDSLDMNGHMTSLAPPTGSSGVATLGGEEETAGEPMDYAPSSSPSPPSSSCVDGSLNHRDCIIPSPVDDDAACMMVDTACDPQQQHDVELDDDTVDNRQMMMMMMTADRFTVADVSQIIDLFYLPFEHGRWSVDSLSEFHWLKTNCPAAGTGGGEAGVSGETAGTCGEPTAEWMKRSRAFVERLREICIVMDKLGSIPNKALLHEIFPYVWDVKAVVLLISAFVQWLGQCRVRCVGQSCLLGGPYSWGNRGYGDYTMNGEREPWLFRGGVLGEFQRMLPFECCTDLLFYTIPDSPQSTMFTVRPYTSADLESVYRVCLQTCADGADGSNLVSTHPQLIPDRLIGTYLHHSADMCFVIEDGEGICGYVLTCTDARSYFHSYRMSWCPLMTEKYPKPSGNISDDSSSQTSLSLAEELINDFYSSSGVESSSDVPESSCTATAAAAPAESLLLRHPSVLRVDMLRSRLSYDPTAPVRALACAVAALKVAGSCGIFSRINVGDSCTAEFYRRLGFFEIPYVDAPPTSMSQQAAGAAADSAAVTVPAADTSAADGAAAADSRTTNKTTSGIVHLGRII